MAEFGLVIVDIFMPGMDGLEAIGALNRHAPETPIIAMSAVLFRDSAKPAPDFLGMAAKLGAASSLHKSLRPRDLPRAAGHAGRGRSVPSTTRRRSRPPHPIWWPEIRSARRDQPFRSRGRKNARRGAMLAMMRDEARNMAPERSPPTEERGQVVQLWPRRGQSGADRNRNAQPSGGAPHGRSPVEDIGKYERGRGDDDYRHRMIMNVLALAACVLLVVVGIWLANTMAQMRKNQDCVLSGRRDCANVHVPAGGRW